VLYNTLMTRINQKKDYINRIVAEQNREDKLSVEDQDYASLKIVPLSKLTFLSTLSKINTTRNEFKILGTDIFKMAQLLNRTKRLFIKLPQKQKSLHNCRVCQ
jgi:hypothetical protein